MKVAILGSTGMLGSMVRRYLSERPEYELTCPGRAEISAANIQIGTLRHILKDHKYVVNCIGIIKPRIDETGPISVEKAIRVNSLFPSLLAEAAEISGCHVLQIATDCVYSGTGTGMSAGKHDELSPHDPLDVYGKTKSLGEVVSPSVHHLRCSIVGPEQEGRPRDSLLEWFLGQPRGATVKGFNNHRWNGITTLAFARICHGIMSCRLALPPLQHIVPHNSVTKAELLSYFAHFYHRDDIVFDEVAAPIAVDRSLATVNPGVNNHLWRAAGYSHPPSIQQLIEEMADYE
jgi:dTDP-4-dehydrorhamnose reductase